MNKTGHFNFAENRTFLLCLDRKICKKKEKISKCPISLNENIENKKNCRRNNHAACNHHAKKLSSPLFSLTLQSGKNIDY
ncbi:MAG: hypothetical protein ACOX2F_06855 [bacterium]